MLTELCELGMIISIMPILNYKSKAQGHTTQEGGTDSRHQPLNNYGEGAAGREEKAKGPHGCKLSPNIRPPPRGAQLSQLKGLQHWRLSTRQDTQTGVRAPRDDGQLHLRTASASEPFLLGALDTPQN